MTFPVGTASLLIQIQVFSASTTALHPSPHPHSPPGAHVTLDPSIIIPSLKLDFRIHVLDYSRDDIISVRPTAVLDQTRKFRDLILSTNSNVTAAAAASRSRGTLLQDRVPKGAVDPSTRVFADAFAPPAYVRDLHSSMILSHSSVGESSYISDMIRAPFFPHVATLIVAIPRYQLEKILPCQLQLTLLNNGQFLHMNHVENRPALAPAPSHLAMNILDVVPRVSKTFSDRGIVDMFSMQIEMSSDRMSAFAATEGLSASQVSNPEFNNYRFSVNYIPRTNVTVQDYSCPSEPLFSVHYAKLLSLLEPSSDRVHVPGFNAYPSPPFQMVLSSYSFQIVVEVVSIKSSSLYTSPPPLPPTHTPLFLTANYPY